MTLITVREEWRWRMVDTIPFSGRAVDDHPHYKMEAHGVGSLTNAELLSLIIGTGMDGKNAVALGERVLASCGDNLNALARLSAYDLMQLDGGYKDAAEYGQCFRRVPAHAPRGHGFVTRGGAYPFA